MIQARKQFVHSGAEGLTWLCSFKRHEQFFRLASTSKKDASHSCLISFSWKQECTTTTQVSKTAVHAVCTWGGVNLPWVTKPCGSFGHKVNNTLRWALPFKSAFLWGRILIQARKQFVRSGAEGPARLCSFKQHEQFLRLAPTSKKDAPHSYLINFSWRQI